MRADIHEDFLSTQFLIVTSTWVAILKHTNTHKSPCLSSWRHTHTHTLLITFSISWNLVPGLLPSSFCSGSKSSPLLPTSHGSGLDKRRSEFTGVCFPCPVNGLLLQQPQPGSCSAPGPTRILVSPGMMGPAEPTPASPP